MPDPAAERPANPDYLSVDEAHPVRPQGASARSRAVGDSISDAPLFQMWPVLGDHR